MIDTYFSFDSLHKAEGPKAYRIICKAKVGASSVIVAPHDGMVEPNTGKIAQSIAGLDCSLYRFVANRPGLHIQSHLFDEPKCLKLIRIHKYVVTIHGCDVNGSKIFIGGLDQALIGRITTALESTAIEVEQGTGGLAGIDTLNICNRGLSGKGVQLELSMAFRKSDRVAPFVSAVRAALNSLAQG